MPKKIQVTDKSASQEVPIHRNPKGSDSRAIAISLPETLHQTINGIVVETKKSRSLVITELIEQGLKSNGK